MTFRHLHLFECDAYKARALVSLEEDRSVVEMWCSSAEMVDHRVEMFDRWFAELNSICPRDLILIIETRVEGLCYVKYFFPFGENQNQNQTENT